MNSPRSTCTTDTVPDPALLPPLQHHALALHYTHRAVPSASPNEPPACKPYTYPCTSQAGRGQQRRQLRLQQRGERRAHGRLRRADQARERGEDCPQLGAARARADRAVRLQARHDQWRPRGLPRSRVEQLCELHGP